MKTKPFDIKYRPQIESGEYKVATREDRPVEIIKWDLKGDFPVIGVYFDEKNDRDTAVQVTANGRCSIKPGDDYCDDFFIVTEESEHLTHSVTKIIDQDDPVSEDLIRVAGLYADKKLEMVDPELAATGYQRHTKMQVRIFDGSDIEEAYLDGMIEVMQQIQRIIPDLISGYRCSNHNSTLPISETWPKIMKEKALSSCQAYHHCLAKIESIGLLDDSWRKENFEILERIRRNRI